MESKDLILFQGLTFDLSVSRTRPMHYGQKQTIIEVPSNLEFFTEFLDEMNKHGLLTCSEHCGDVVYADDQFVNQHMMKTHFKDLGIEDRLIMFTNGHEVVEHFKGILNAEESQKSIRRQPIPLLLLDVNMPVLNGLETLIQVKQ